MSAAEGDLSCQELVELVTEYLERRMPADERTRFDFHLALCGPCRVYLDQIREVVRTARRLGEPAEIPDSLREELLAAFRASKCR